MKRFSVILTAFLAAFLMAAPLPAFAEEAEVIEAEPEPAPELTEKAEAVTAQVMTRIRTEAEAVVRRTATATIRSLMTEMEAALTGQILKTLSMRCMAMILQIGARRSRLLSPLR